MTTTGSFVYKGVCVIGIDRNSFVPTCDTAQQNADTYRFCSFPRDLYDNYLCRLVISVLYL